MKVCYDRPNRSEPRFFTASDAARIARYAASQDGSLDVLAAVIAALALESTVFIYDCCPKSCDDTDPDNPDSVDRQSKGKLAIGNAQKQLARLSSLPVVRNPVVRGALAVIEVSLSSLAEWLFNEPVNAIIRVDCTIRLTNHFFLQGKTAFWTAEFGD
jgi:hypothetical protein